ncbi:FecR family protein [Aestuariibaculum sediminum]|uniref:FecR domain-containing protein n=1 Tax=Aestuariibaculum sediminum TaxID=2770637 RepID=A0A8J6U9P0_9FLAO|nr:FecR family protein [Aestuariibaculum sediminum]MBD0833447.1 FecR domain-containing protein [Aestuariibaculum sediminum]
MAPEIENILIKYLSRSANAEELSQLSDWLKIESNRKVFKDYVQTHYAISYSVKTPNTTETVKVLLHNIRENEPKVRKLNVVSVLKYAAVLVLFVAVGTGVYNQFYNNAIDPEEAIKDIVIGHERATLVLSDGSTVDLEMNKNTLIAQDDMAKIETTNEGLVYNVSESTEVLNTSPKINTLHVPVGGVYQIQLPDGTKVWLNSATSLEFPERFVGDQRAVKLQGEAYFKVTKSTKPFIVETESANITVLGTQFNVSAYKGDSYFSSTLVEGSIALQSDLKASKSNILEPGQRAVIQKFDASIDISKVDTEVYTAWKEGKFYFERESLEQILIKMSRWYNVDVFFETETLKHEYFTGVVYKNKSVDYLLNMISQTTKVNYKITKNKKNGKYEITITK